MNRKILAPFLVLVTAIAFLVQLAKLQIFDTNSNTFSTVKQVFDYPDRGYIYDRNQVLLVANQPGYDVMVIPKEVKAFDTISFINYLKIDKEYFDRQFEKAQNYSPRLPSVLVSQLAKEDYAVLQEKLHHFPGFYIQKRALREYPVVGAANILGYLNEVSPAQASESDYYQAGEIIGQFGIEKQYEELLRGQKGIQFKQRDRLNRVIGKYKDGKDDKPSLPGADLTLTIDSELQLLGEELMLGKRGGIVALDPKSGEVLALITAPSYDPNLMVGRKRRQFSPQLFNDSINKPMIDRGLQAMYSPGSPFKMITGLIALQEGVISPRSTVRCYNGYRYGNRPNEFMGCHCGIYNQPIAMVTGIAKSCNSYFSDAYRKSIEKYPTAADGMENWAKHVESFGLGGYLGYDLPSGQKGLIPDANYYNRYYPSGSWKAVTTISNAIGQGEILTTPIQLANMTAAIANRGYYYTPHFLKEIDGEPISNEEFTKAKKTSIDPEHFEPVIQGMAEVFRTGTGRWFNIPELEMCGKTGTVQNYVRYEGEKIEMPDHSIFVAFAPRNDPKIALAIFVENAGYGATYAAPMASLMIEKHLKGEISPNRQYLKNRMVEQSLDSIYQLQLNEEYLESRREHN
jgi:penicillin-binding protein 2